MFDRLGVKLALVALMVSLNAGGALAQMNGFAVPDDPTPRITDRVSTPPQRNSKRNGGSDDKPGLQARYFGTSYELTCAPAGRQGNLNIVNTGLYAVPDGTRILWRVAETGERGMFELIGDLQPGETLLADHIVSNGPMPTRPVPRGRCESPRSGRRDKKLTSKRANSPHDRGFPNERTLRHLLCPRGRRPAVAACRHVAGA